jgi:hypothetical protein
MYELCTLYCGVYSVPIHFQSIQQNSYIQELPSSIWNLSQSLRCINNRTDVPNETRNDAHKPNPRGVNVNRTGNRVVGFVLALFWVHKCDHMETNAIHGWGLRILKSVLKRALKGCHIRIRNIQSEQIKLQRSECASVLRSLHIPDLYYFSSGSSSHVLCCGGLSGLLLPPAYW